MSDDLDRFWRHDELTAWLTQMAEAHPDLVELSSYGRSHEGRELWLVTLTDSATGAHHTKPAHWVDAAIHSIELTATVAACHLIRRLVTGHAEGDPTIRRALARRTFYVAPRVNPDGAEAALADRPRFRRSSMRPWPDGRRWPGLHGEDIDGDGRILQMRIPDPDGAWTPDPDQPRLLVPVPAEGTDADTPRYRLLAEGSVSEPDGWTIPSPRAVEGLDLNRNYPAGWGTGVTGSGDHPLSEPEIAAVVAAIVARPNICGAHALHTSGGVLLRPSSTRPDADLPPDDVWIWTELGRRATELTGYPVHSVYEDFTWDRSDTMSGASDDWAYEHRGIYAWTTELWDVVEAATGTKQSTHFWYLGPTPDEARAVLAWCDEHHPEGCVDWYPVDHPQLGPVELGGWNSLTVWTNPPPHLLAAEVAAHAEVFVHQALCAPELVIAHLDAERLGPDLWRITAGVANTGWLPTDVSAWARKHSLVAPVVVELDGGELVEGERAQRLGQLEGRAALTRRQGNDGTGDRARAHWLVRSPEGTRASITASHPRAGTDQRTLTLT